MLNPKSLFFYICSSLLTLSLVYRADAQCGDPNPAVGVSFTEGSAPLDPYAADADCTWEIAVTEGNQILVNFERLEVKNDETHYLEFYRNHVPDLEENALVKLKGNMIAKQAAILLESPQFIPQVNGTIKFKTTGDSGGKAGITMNYEALPQLPVNDDCGGTLTFSKGDDSKVITDGSDEASNYAVPKHCRWTITWDINDPEKPDTIDATYKSLDLTEQESQHYIAMYDGEEYEDDLHIVSGFDSALFPVILGSGENPAQTFSARTGKMTIVYQARDTGKAVGGKGFKLELSLFSQFVPKPDPDCFQDVTVESGSEGTLTHPGTEDNGGGKSDANFCRITLSTPGLDDILKITVTELSLFQSADIELTVFNGDPASTDEILFQVKGDNTTGQAALVGMTFSVNGSTSVSELISLVDGQVAGSTFKFTIQAVLVQDDELPDDYYDDYFPRCQERDIAHGSRIVTDGSAEGDAYDSDIDCSWIFAPATAPAPGEEKYSRFVISRIDLRNSADHVLGFYKGSTSEKEGLWEEITGADVAADPTKYSNYMVTVFSSTAGVWFNTTGSAEGATGWSIASMLVDASEVDDDPYLPQDDFIEPSQEPPPPPADDDGQPPPPGDDDFSFDDGTDDYFNNDDGTDDYFNNDDGTDDYFNDDGTDDYFNDDGTDDTLTDDTTDDTLTDDTTDDTVTDDTTDDTLTDDTTDDTLTDDTTDDTVTDDTTDDTTDDSPTECNDGKTCTTLTGTEQLDAVATLINDIAIQINTNKRVVEQLKTETEEMQTAISILLV